MKYSLPLVIVSIFCAQAFALRAKNGTTASQLAPATGLLCREPAGNSSQQEFEIVLQEGGKRSLAFTRAIHSRGEFIGREVSGLQSTVHCAIDVAAHANQRCLPADSKKPVPSCTEVGKTGDCACTSVTEKLPELSYQREMVSDTLLLCKAKAKIQQPFRVLMFGLGGGTVPMYLRHGCEVAQVESVELDDRMALMAQRLFGFRPDSYNKVEIADGQEAAQRRAATKPRPNGQHYDAVLVDCFSSDNRVAPSCRSEKFVASVRSVLRPGGRVFQNSMSEDDAELFSLYKSIFGAVAVENLEVQKGQFVIVAKTLPNHEHIH